MRTLRLAVVLLALAVFIGGMMAAADAATVPSVISTPVKKAMATTTKVPTLAKLPALKMLGGLEKFSQANDAAGNAVKQEAAMMTMGIQNDIGQRYGKMSNMISIPGMGQAASQLDHLRQMPAMGKINMPDWTTPGIILTI